MPNKLDELQQKISDYKLKNSAPVYNTEYSSSPAKICIEIISSVIVGIIIGGFLDYLFNTKLLFLFICIILSTGAGFYSIYKSTQMR